MPFVAELVVTLGLMILHFDGNHLSSSRPTPWLSLAAARGYEYTTKNNVTNIFVYMWDICNDVFTFYLPGETISLQFVELHFPPHFYFGKSKQKKKTDLTLQKLLYQWIILYE